MDIEKVVLEIGQRASEASEELGKAASTTKNQGLKESKIKICPFIFYK